MAALSIIHILLGFVAVIVGLVIFFQRKGDARHRLLGWIYAACMLISLVAIIVRGAAHPVPFHGYAAVIALGVMTAILLSRFRRGFPAWRSWHAGLMALSMLGAVTAIGGVIGGLALGMPTGPGYYMMFNAIIVAFGIIGLWLINTRAVIWGALQTRERTARLWFSGFVVMLTAALVISQYALLT